MLSIPIFIKFSQKSEQREEGFFLAGRYTKLSQHDNQDSFKFDVRLTMLSYIEARQETTTGVALQQCA